MMNSLSIEELVILGRALALIATGDIIHEDEFGPRIGIKLEDFRILVEKWPAWDDRNDDSSECMAINNTLNELLNGVGISDELCSKSLGASRDELRGIFHNWVAGRGWFPCSGSPSDALCEACANGDTVAALTAIRDGADPNTQYRKRTALNWAAQEGHEELVALLLSHGADANLVDDDEECVSPLLTAAGEGHVGIVRRLIQAGADPKTKAYDDGTSLHIAAAWGYLDCVKELVRAGADIDARDDDDKCAADYAEMRGHTEVAEFLREA